MNDLENVEKNIQLCLLAIDKTNSVSGNKIFVYRTFIDAVNPDAIPFFLSKKFHALKACIDESAGHYAASESTETLRLLIDFYKEISGWLAIENYLENQSRIKYYASKTG